MQPTTIDKKALLAQILKRKKIKADELIITTNDIRHITFKQIIDLYLCFMPVKKWHWRDNDGNETARTGFFKSVIDLKWDVFTWWFKKQSIQSQAKKLEDQIGTKAPYTPKDKLKVLYLRADHWFKLKSGGSVGHVSGVINALKKLGHNVHVFASDHLAEVEEDDQYYLCDPEYKTHTNIPEGSELKYNAQLLEFVKAKWNSIKPDLIYQRYSLGNFVAIALKKLYNVPVISEYNGSFVWMSKNWGAKLIHKKLIGLIEKISLSAADLIVVVSEVSKEELLERGFDEKLILVNPNGVNAEKYHPEVPCDNVKEKYNLHDKNVVGFIGSFGQWHGVLVMAEAIVSYQQKYPEQAAKTSFLIIGDGKLFPDVQDILKVAPIPENVILTGRIPQAEGPAHLSFCDIFLSPHIKNPDGTKFFGSPTKLFEYMAMGRAVIASDLDQLGEILEHEKTAYLTEPGNAEALADSIKHVIDNPELKQSLANYARQEALEKYTWNTHVEKILARLAQDRK